MELKLRMTLLTDTIFGNGVSVPGGEDLSVLCDAEGFPYYKGGTFKGIFREELENLMEWQPEYAIDVQQKLGQASDDSSEGGKLRFYDFQLPPNVKARVKESIASAEDVLDAFTYLRTFTALEESGIVKEGTLRVCRCLKKGISFEGKMECEKEDCVWVEEVLGLMKWIGTMRNRGFGKVKIEIAEQ